MGALDFNEFYKDYKRRSSNPLSEKDILSSVGRSDFKPNTLPSVVDENRSNRRQYILDDIIKKSRQSNPVVLEEGLKQYNENLAQGMPEPVSEVTVDDFERLGNERIKKLTDRPWGTAITDTGKAVMSGIYSGVGDAIGYGIEAAGEKFGNKSVADYGGEMRKIQQAEGEKWSKSISPGGQRMVNTPLFDGWKPSIDDHFLGSLVMKAAQSAPGMVAMMPLGGAITKGITTIGGAVLPKIAGALVKGAASPVGKNLLQAVKTQGLYRALADRALSLIPSAVGYGSAEGGLAGLQNAAQTRTEIETQNQDELFKNSPTYREYIEKHGGNRDKAQKELAKDAAGDVALKTLVSTGGIGILTGGGAVGMLSRNEKRAAEGIIKTFFKGAGEEALQEYPQSGAEAYIQNLATRDYTDPTFDPMTGVWAQAAEGGAVGGFLGGTVGGGGKVAQNIGNIGKQKTISDIDTGLKSGKMKSADAIKAIKKNYNDNVFDENDIADLAMNHPSVIGPKLGDLLTKRAEEIIETVGAPGERAEMDTFEDLNAPADEQLVDEAAMAKAEQEAEVLKAKEARQARLDKIQKEYPALDKMVEEVGQGEPKGYTPHEGGGGTAFGSTYPEWMQTLNKNMKKGQPLFSKKEVLGLINHFKEGTLSTKTKPGQKKDSQYDRFELIKQAAKDYSLTEIDTVAGADAEYLKKQGFEPMGGRKFAAGELKPGDKFVGNLRGGDTDTFTVKRKDVDGNIVIEDGETFKVDEFNQIKVEALKRKTEKSELPDMDKAHEMTFEEYKAANRKIEEIENVPVAEYMTDEELRKEHEGLVKGIVTPEAEKSQEGAVEKAEDVVKTVNKALPGNDLSYDGVQEDANGNPAFHQFTAYEGTAKGATFLVDSLEPEKIQKTLEDKIKEFTKAKIAGEVGGEEVAPALETPRAKAKREKAEAVQARKDKRQKRREEKKGVQAKTKREFENQVNGHFYLQGKSVLPDETTITQERSKGNGNSIRYIATSPDGEIKTSAWKIATNTRNTKPLMSVLPDGEKSVMERDSEKWTEWENKNKLPEIDTWKQSLDDYLKREGVFELDKKDQKRKDAVMRHYESVQAAVKAKEDVPKENLDRYGMGEGDAQSRAMEKYYAKQVAKEKAPKPTAPDTQALPEEKTGEKQADTEKAPVGEKSPWKMSKEDLLKEKDNLTQKLSDDYWKFSRSTESKPPEGHERLNDILSALGEKKQRWERPYSQVKSRMPKSAHKKMVAKALESGKPVPVNVLKDYPELAEKQADTVKPGEENTPIGRAYIKGKKVNIFGQVREITKGKNKGKVEVEYRHKGEFKKKIVDAKNVEKSEPLFQREKAGQNKVAKIDPEYAFLTKEQGKTDTPENIALHNTKVEILQKLWDNDVFSKDLILATQYDSIDEMIVEDLEAALQKIGDQRYVSEIYQEQLDNDGVDWLEEFKPTNDLFEYAKKAKGTTEDLNEAGYVLPDGTLLDFSGKKEGGPGGERAEDHRQLGLPLQGDISGTDAMIAFQKLGAVRIDNNSHSVDMEVAPTPAQLSVIEKVLGNKGYVDLNDGDRRRAQIENNNTRKTIGLIKRFYSGEDIGNQVAFSKSQTDFSTITRKNLLSLTRTERRILKRHVKQLQKIKDPTDTDVINFISDAIHDTNLQTDKIKPILKKLGIEDALHNNEGRSESPSGEESSAKQRFREVLGKWGYKGAAKAVLRSRPKTREEKTAQKIIKALGVNAVWFETKDSSLTGATGITLPQYPDTIYINAKANDPLIAVAGHEFTHTLKRNHPDLYEFLHNSIKDNIIDFEGYIEKNNLAREGIEKIKTDALAYEEFYGDFVGDSMVDPKFWQALSKENPTLTQKLAKVIRDILDRIKRAVKRYGRRTEGHLENIDHARDVVAKVVSEVSKRETVTRTTADGVKFQTVPLAQKWYSEVTKAVEAMNFKAMPGQDLINRLKKTPGVKAAELDWMGIEEAFGDKKKVMKAEVQDWLEKNQVVVEEVVKGEPTDEQIEAKAEELHRQAVNDRVEEAEYYGDVISEDQRIDISNDISWPYEEAEEALKESGTKFEAYQDFHGKDYKEVHVTFPGKSTIYDKTTDEYAQKFYGLPFSEIEDEQKSFIGGVMRRDAKKSGEEPRKSWQEGHPQYSDIENPVVRLRFSTVEKDGKTYMGIEELQGVQKGEQEKQPEFMQTPDYWALMGFKWAVRYAAENGMDGVVWLPGQLQADRYDLSRHIDELSVVKHKDGTAFYQAHKGGSQVMDGEIAQNKLDSVIGKELAQKVLDSKDQHIVFSGLDLKVGGEGLKNLYDTVLPRIANKFFNKAKWGKAKVGEVVIQNNAFFPYKTVNNDYVIKTFDNEFYRGGPEAFSPHQEDAVIFKTENDAIAKIKKSWHEKYLPMTAHSLPITPKMRSKALREGMPVFQKETAEAKKNLEADTLSILENIKVMFNPKRLELTKEGKEDLTYIDLLASLPNFFKEKIKGIKLMFDATQRRQDHTHELITWLEKDENAVSTVKNWKDLKKASKDVHVAARDYLLDKDRAGTAYTVRATEDGKAFTVNSPNGKIRETFTTEIEALQSALEFEAEDMAKAGYSPEAIAAVMGHRKTMNKGFELLIKAARDLTQRVNEINEDRKAQNLQPIEMPEIASYDANGNKVMISMEAAMVQMGDLRGSYFPRIREKGAYLLRAKHPTKDNWMHTFNSLDSPPMKKKENHYKRQGYTVTIEPDNSLGEDVFDIAGELVKTQQLVNAALEQMDKKGLDISPEIETIFAASTAEHIGNVIKGRGSRVHMVKRADEYYRGFEEDPELATSKYISGMAAGEAKRVMTLELLQAFTGTSISWRQFKEVQEFEGDYAAFVDDFRKRNMQPDNTTLSGFKEMNPLITQEWFDEHSDFDGIKENKQAIKKARTALKDEIDPEAIETLETSIKEMQGYQIGKYRAYVSDMMIDQGQQARAFKWGKAYIKEMTRNQERVDRIIGQVRGMAVAKFLAFRVFSAPLVNITAMGTSVPASMMGEGIKLRTIPKLLSSAIKTHFAYKYTNRESISASDKWVLDRIHDEGWDNPQFNSEAMAALRGAHGRVFDKIMEVGMFTFAESERMNRVATILGAYNGLIKGKMSGKAKEDILTAAKQISDDSHGVYNKGNHPFFAMGDNPAAHVARSFYVFRTFSHTYLLNMRKMGIKKEYGALAYMALSPAVIAGMGASIMTPMVMTLLKAFGWDDPEEEFYDYIGKELSPQSETFARFGLAGASGFSMKGSLAIGIMDLPTSLGDLLGAPGSVLSDTFHKAPASFIRGDILKGLEKISPTGIGNLFRGYREGTQGLTTRSNAPLFFGNEQVKLTPIESYYRTASLNPARIATIREKQWSETKIRMKYKEKNHDIYAKIKKWYATPDRDLNRWAEIWAEVEDYNLRVSRHGISPITRRSIRSNLRRNFRPSRRERRRARERENNLQ